MSVHPISTTMFWVDFSGHPFKHSDSDHPPTPLLPPPIFQHQKVGNRICTHGVSLGRALLETVRVEEVMVPVVLEETVEEEEVTPVKLQKGTHGSPKKTEGNIYFLQINRKKKET